MTYCFLHELHAEQVDGNVLDVPFSSIIKSKLAKTMSTDCIASQQLIYRPLSSYDSTSPHHLMYFFRWLNVQQGCWKLSEWWQLGLIGVTVFPSWLLLHQGWQSYVIIAFVICSFFLSMSRITHERVNGRRPIMVDMGIGWPSRSD